MKNLSLIAAFGPNRELGYENKLIWHIKEDLAFYKAMTMGKNIIMGRLTYESLPKVALKGRKPIVLTRNIFDDIDNLKYFNDIDTLLKFIEASDEDFMVIGGALVYKQFLPYVDTMYLTNFSDNIEHKADTYFPEFDISNWNTELLFEGREEDVNYQIKKYVRKRTK